MNEEKMTFNMTYEDGKEVECELLFTFQSDETNKNYWVYTDNERDEEGKLKVFAQVYTPDPENPESINLTPIESDNEWKIIEKITDEIVKSGSNEQN